MMLISEWHRKCRIQFCVQAQSFAGFRDSEVGLWYFESSFTCRLLEMNGRDLSLPRSRIIGNSATVYSQEPRSF